MPRKKVPVNVAMRRKGQDTMVPHAGYATYTLGLMIIRALYWDRVTKRYKVDTARRWQIIHQASGYQIGSDFLSLGDASEVVNRLKPLGNWSASAEELLRTMPQEKIKEVLYGR